MKIIEIIKKMCSSSYKLRLISGRNAETRGTVFFLTTIDNTKKNGVKIFDSKVSKSDIMISGLNNDVEIVNSNLNNASINIKGNNNKLRIAENNIIQKMNILLFGENCVINIKRHAIINGIRIVNVGRVNSIEIGENCLFSDHIDIYGSDTHSIYDHEGNFINPEKDVIINDHVWIGAHVKILKGVTIGEGAVIGMGSIVTKNVAPHALVAGNPARVIRENIDWTTDYESIKDLDIYNAELAKQIGRNNVHYV
jgi:acetyltransferase-like isoleucine patch superfamily enzyme